MKTLTVLLKENNSNYFETREHLESIFCIDNYLSDPLSIDSKNTIAARVFLSIRDSFSKLTFDYPIEFSQDELNLKAGVATINALYAITKIL